VLKKARATQLPSHNPPHGAGRSVLSLIRCKRGSATKPSSVNMGSPADSLYEPSSLANGVEKELGDTLPGSRVSRARYHASGRVWTSLVWPSTNILEITQIAMPPRCQLFGNHVDLLTAWRRFSLVKINA
jgi:hypothetical protein